ncbi:glycosyltransferase [Sphingorhabdus sp. Alg239-R122]|uniref:glycosyltransferase n=1 Tax=Sphingorhabdus sp. Alg239-R122 TaxID=2305989 RepID=UPI0013DC8942|nr:glycosyltransferase [Sphingorhabdus sp. Alg239-R122]
MTIVHISTDYPDIFVPAKTHAIKNLMDVASGDYAQFIYSLNRINISLGSASLAALKGWKIDEVDSGQDGIACLTYTAPSKGLFLKSVMTAIARHIVRDIQVRGIKPTLIQGHKLSMEGIIAYHVAQALQVPFALSVQGNSDRTILNVRRDLWPLYRKIFHEAAIIFPFTPWALKYLESVLGKRVPPTVMLPCITGQDVIIEPRNTKPVIVSAFHLRHWRLKNLPALIAAAVHMQSANPDFELHIIGGGEAEHIAEVEGQIAKSGVTNIRLLGAIPHDQIQKVMNRAAGLAMLSHRESFGMVFVEALLAGCPVLYPEDAAIDGYFDDNGFAIAVPANNQAAINKAFEKLVRDNAALKEELQVWQHGEGASFFQKKQIAASYIAGLNAATSRDN